MKLWKLFCILIAFSVLLCACTQVPAETPDDEVNDKADAETETDAEAAKPQQSDQEQSDQEQPDQEQPDQEQPDQEQPPSTDEKQPDQPTAPEIEELGPEACIYSNVHLKSIEQLVAFNKNSSILNLGDENTTNWMLSLHKEGNILSRDSIYVPVMPSTEYELYEIIQTPIETAFVYYAADAKTYEEQSKSELWIYISYVDEDRMALVEKRYGAERDADGYLYLRNEPRIFFKLEENCYIEVYDPKPDGKFGYDFARSLCQVRAVNVNPNAVIK